MSARQIKKRKGRSQVNNRERTVTTFTEDPNTCFLVPFSSEDLPTTFSPSFSMNYQNYIPTQQQQFYQPILPPGKNDLEILENLKTIIKEGQHEFYRAVPQPAALASLYMGHIPQPDLAQQEYPTPRFSHDSVDPSGDTALVNNTVEPHSPLPVTPDVDTIPEPSNPLPAQPVSDDVVLAPADTKTDPKGEYGARPPVDTPSPNKATVLDATKDDQPPQDTTWERRTIDDTKDHYDDRNPSPTRVTTYDRPPNGATTTTAAHFLPPEDNSFYDKDRDRDRDRLIDRERDRDWERDRDRHSLTRDTRDRGRDREIRDRRPEFLGRTYGRSHAPRPPPELRHYEPSYGADYVPPPRRFEPDDRRGSLRSASLDDRSKPPFDDRRPPLDDRRPPPADDRRLALDDRPMRPLPGSDTRLPQGAEDRARPAGEAIPLARATAEVDRDPRATSLAADDRTRAIVPLEERLSQPAPPSLQDRLSQPSNVPARVDMPAPTLEERLSLGPASRYRPPSVARDDLRLAKDDRNHDRMTDFRRDLSRERPPLTASSYRPNLDRFGERDERERRDRDRDVDEASARLEFGRPARRYSPPPTVLDRERERARPYYPTRSPPPMREYHPDADKRYTSERERDAYERRREWYPEDDKREPAPPPPASWRPHERAFVERERFDRERERDGGRERGREGALGPPPAPPTRGHWDERERRFPMSLPLPPLPARMDATDGPRSLSARLTDAYPPPPPPPASGDERTYGTREFERGRYAGLDDHHGPGHAHGPPPFSRVRNRSPTPPRRGPLAEDLRPPLKRMREDNAGYTGPGGGAAYSPPRREYVPGPPPSSSATTASVVPSVGGTVPPRSSEACTPPNTSGVFYDRDREREREREYVRGEYGMGYDRGRRSPPVGRMGPGYARMGRDDRRYVPPPPRTT